MGKTEQLTGNYNQSDSLLTLAYQALLGLYGEEHTVVAEKLMILAA